MTTDPTSHQDALSMADRDVLARHAARLDGWPSSTLLHDPDLIAAVERIVAARVAAARAEALQPLEDLFAGGPDTPCRTTYPGGVVECVEVPMADLRAAFDAARAVVSREPGEGDTP